MESPVPPMGVDLRAARRRTRLGGARARAAAAVPAVRPRRDVMSGSAGTDIPSAVPVTRRPVRTGCLSSRVGHDGNELMDYRPLAEQRMHAGFVRGLSVLNFKCRS